MAPIAATGQSQMEAAPNSDVANSKFVKMPVVTEMTENDTANIEKSFSVRRSSCLYPNEVSSCSSA